MSLNTLLKKAILELNVYEFKLFWYVFSQTVGQGNEWSRIRQKDAEGHTGISHPTTLKYMALLRGENKEDQETEDGSQRNAWIKAKTVTYPETYGRVYALADGIVAEYLSRG